MRILRGMIYQNNYAPYRLWKIWSKMKTVASSIRAIFFAYTYNWFINKFCLKQSNVVKNCVFSELKSIHPPNTDEVELRILEIGTGPGNMVFKYSKNRYVSMVYV